MTSDGLAENAMRDLLGKAVVSADALRDELIARFGTAGHGAFPVVKARVNEADIANAVWRDLMGPRNIGAVVCAHLHKAELEEAERYPNGWLH